MNQILQAMRSCKSLPLHYKRTSSLGGASRAFPLKPIASLLILALAAGPSSPPHQLPPFLPSARAAAVPPLGSRSCRPELSPPAGGVRDPPVAGAAGGCRGPRRWRRGCTLGRTGSRDAGAGLRADGVCAEPPSAGAPPSRRAPSVTADTHNLPQTSLVSFCEKQLPRESI